jgi:hypothetical protein
LMRSPNPWPDIREGTWHEHAPRCTVKSCKSRAVCSQLVRGGCGSRGVGGLHAQSHPLPVPPRCGGWPATSSIGQSIKIARAAGGCTHSDRRTDLPTCLWMFGRWPWFLALQNGRKPPISPPSRIGNGVRDAGAGGSNPLTPTRNFNELAELSTVLSWQREPVGVSAGIRRPKKCQSGKVILRSPARCAARPYRRG